MSGVVLVIAGLTAAGGVIAAVDPGMLIGTAAPETRATYVYAGYLVSRNLALAVALVALLALRARRMLAGALLLTALIQILDIVVDAATGRLALVPGLVVLTAALFAATVKASPEPPWRLGTWRDPHPAADHR
ncbi:MAG: hypothetical protein ABI083_12835 [Lapillicoccus sp.]